MHYLLLKNGYTGLSALLDITILILVVTLIIWVIRKRKLNN
ncbi:MAG: hypothetical protein RR577_04670 [Erysipelotrichales bacterium]